MPESEFLSESGTPTASARQFCSIAPPDLLAWLATQGTTEQREAAIQSIATSAAMRSRRAVLGHFSRELNQNIGLIGVVSMTEQGVSVYDNEKNGRNFLPGVKKRAVGDPLAADPAVNEAFDGSSQTAAFYRDVLERNSLDNAGMELISSVHYGVGFDNAFWDGSQMVYGDGSGRIFQAGGLTRAIDVIAHELTHGVTEFTAGLVYSKQSGALNESFSDVFGSLVKQYNLKQTAADATWLIGEGILVPTLGLALRSMQSPGTAFAGDHQPGHMDNYVDLPDDNNPANDNGGVHVNSGIPNHAFYLAAIALGGSAWEKAGKIWYNALTTKLGPNTQFVEAAQFTIDSAGELFGAAEQAAVRSAWTEVGVLG
ncbi:M4 family metallopeptidase [Cryobacterium roopkundense]|uniref:Neutral metalloproteinase n=1 Tax=Cryobacterium roopkundense TaxID=1001240 RepID=A0A7W8ZZ46_9MICO|nr:M4 family metallopeptidase [Cryobacterium roopkundense]MBB5642841.1 Zn-dependent metalloprotease [Cryobacterium roopkundense]